MCFHILFKIHEHEASYIKVYHLYENVQWFLHMNGRKSYLWISFILHIFLENYEDLKYDTKHPGVIVQ